MSNYMPVEKIYNVEEFEKFVEAEIKKPGNENNRYELIDGVIYMMANPTITHYNVCKFIERAFDNYFGGKGCTVFNGSVSLNLFKGQQIPHKKKRKNYLTPDLMVICDKRATEIDEGVFVTPDIVVEVISKSNAGTDYFKKLDTYFTFGIKEYWIVDPIKKKIRINDMTANEVYDYTFDSVVESAIFGGLVIDFKKFTGFVDKGEEFNSHV